MADDWIKMRVNLTRNPRVLKMSASLSVPPLHVVGMLYEVWAWADTHSEDGNAVSVTGETLDCFAGVTGFADALRKVGWLEGCDDALTFPHFDQHNGQTAKKRANTSKRVKKHRNADVTQQALPEKRREEKSREDSKDKHFDSFWKAYPSGSRKVDKPKCLAKWKAEKLDAIADDVIGGLARWKNSEDWTKEGGKYICGPHKWLNQRYWEADPKPASSTMQSDPGGVPIKLGTTER